MADRPTSVAGVLTELDTANISFTILAELQFADGTVNLWLGPKDATLSYDSKTWTGTGDLGSLEVIEESEGISAAPLVATMHASTAQIDTAELVTNEGRAAIFYIMLFDTTTGAIIGHIADPREMGRSWIEPGLQEAEGEKLVISDLKMEFVAEGGIMKRIHRRKLTYTDGLEIDPDDHFLEFSADPDQSTNAGPLKHSSTAGGSLPGVGQGVPLKRLN